MIRALFGKSGSLDSNQKHRSTAENNLSNLVSGLYSARSHGTRVKYISFFHKFIFLIWVLLRVAGLLELEGPVSEDKDDKRREYPAQTLAGHERNPLWRLPFLQHHN